MRLDTLLARETSWGLAIKDFLHDCSAERNLRPKTIAHYEYHLEQLQKWAEWQEIELESFSRPHMRDYQASRKTKGGREGTGASEKTRRSDVLCAKRFFAFCADEDPPFIESNPLVKYKLPRADDSYVYMPTIAEVKAVLDAIDNRWNPRKNPKVKYTTDGAPRFFRTRDKAIYSAILDTAAREDEVLSLRLEEVRLGERLLVFPKTKGRRPRAVPMSPECYEFLEAWKKIRPAKAECEFFFITQFGTKIKPDSWGHSFRTYRDYAGLTVFKEIQKNGKTAKVVDKMRCFSLHGIRHFSLNKVAKVDLESAMRLAGHQDPKVTIDYLREDADYIRKAHAEAGVLRMVLGNTESAESSRKRRTLIKKR